jgi:hypothetical protein
MESSWQEMIAGAKPIIKRVSFHYMAASAFRAFSTTGFFGKYACSPRRDPKKWQHFSTKCATWASQDDRLRRQHLRWLLHPRQMVAQQFRDILRRLKAFLRILGVQLRDNCFEPIGNLRIDLAHRPRRVIDHPLEHCHRP